MPVDTAKGMERALAIALLIYCGLRISSLRTLELADFRFIDKGRCILVVPAERTKGDRALEHDLNPEVAALLRRHIAHHRPEMPGAHGSYLFPGEEGGARSKTAHVEWIREACARAGLEMNLHLFRHAIAKIAVEGDPGAYLSVSRVLGHTTLDTTMAHYLGTESKAAGRHVDRLAHRGQRQGKDLPPRRWQTHALANRKRRVMAMTSSIPCAAPCRSVEWPQADQAPGWAPSPRATLRPRRRRGPLGSQRPSRPISSIMVAGSVTCLDRRPQREDSPPIG